MIWFCWKTETFAHEISFVKSQKRAFALIIFAVHQQTSLPARPSFSEVLDLQKYLKVPEYYRLFCFDRFCFVCVVCSFWWLYGFLWWVLAIEKLEYSRYNTKTKYELFYTTLIIVDYYSYTNGSHEGFVEFCVIEVFKFWVILRWMKEG